MCSLKEENAADESSSCRATTAVWRLHISQHMGFMGVYDNVSRTQIEVQQITMRNFIIYSPLYHSKPKWQCFLKWKCNMLIVFQAFLNEKQVYLLLLLLLLLHTSIKGLFLPPTGLECEGTEILLLGHHGHVPLHFLDMHSQTSLSTFPWGNSCCHFGVCSTSWSGQGKFLWTDPRTLEFD